MYLRKQTSPLLHSLCIVSWVQHAVLEIPAESSVQLQSSLEKFLQIEKLCWGCLVRVRPSVVQLMNDNTVLLCCLFAQRWIHAGPGILSEGLSEQALPCASQDHLLPKNSDCESQGTESLVFLSFPNVRLRFPRVATNMSVPLWDWKCGAWQQRVEGGAVFKCHTVLLAALECRYCWCY